MRHTLDIQTFTKNISDLDLANLSAKNPDYRFETNAEGKLILMSPTPK